MSPLRRTPRPRTHAERLALRGDVRRLVRILGKHDWLVDRDGLACDLAVGSRIEAVAALGSLETAEAEDGVVFALGDDDPRVRRAAVDRLRTDPSPKAAKALAQAAARWRDPSLAEARDAALEVLVALDDEVLAAVVAETLVDESEEEELTAAEERTLRRLFAGEKGPATDVLAERLTQRLSAADGRERRRAYQALVALGGAAVDPLVRALTDSERRHEAGAALGAIRDTRPVPALIALLEHGDADGRLVAARTLGAIRDPRSLDALVRAGKDADADVRDAALDALDRLGAVVDVLGTAAFAESIAKRLGMIEAEHPEPRAGGAERQRATPVPPRSLLQRCLRWWSG